MTQLLTSRTRGGADTRERLLQAVTELQAESGWAACTLKAVATRAGLTTGAVYSTFGSRGALLATWIVRRVEPYGFPADEPSLDAAVASFARGYYAQTQTAEGIELVTMQLDLVRQAATDAALADALSEGYALLLGDLVAGLDARGAAVDSLSTEQLARRLVAVLQGLLIQKLAFAPAVEEQDFVDAARA
ncbi:MAG: TetR/AcrR family transcriptional regulator, partial [Chitinophagaceae bacterium]